MMRGRGGGGEGRRREMKERRRRREGGGGGRQDGDTGFVGVARNYRSEEVEMEELKLDGETKFP